MILLIHCRDEILRLGREQAADGLKRIHILLMLRLDDKYNPLDVRLDVQLLRTVINVNQKQVVKQQVLDKIVLVKALLIATRGSEPEMPPSCRPCIRRRFRPWQEVYI